jgi:uncharacterized membrane-anchored protein
MPAVHGTLRADRRTKNLVSRLRAGDIALIHHSDLDATAARALADKRPAAVINATASISGRYPNMGPSILNDAGIPLIDEVGDEFFEKALAEDQTATLDGTTIRLSNGTCADGKLLDRDGIETRHAAARENLGKELDLFARNTLEYLVEEKTLLLDPVNVPELKTQMRGRHAMVVVRGEGYEEDLKHIGDYLRDVRPVVIAVDGAADALLKLGVKPHILIGDMDSVSDEAIKCGAEVIVHGYAKGDRKAPGLERIEKLGVDAKVFHATGTSEDIAMLLADEKGASLILAVGTHFSLVDFLDKGRGGMASTFLVRLRIGSKLVDAKGVGRLWAQRSRPMTREIVLLVAAALFPLVVVAYQSPLANTWLRSVRLWFRSSLGLH